MEEAEAKRVEDKENRKGWKKRRQNKILAYAHA